MSWLKRVGKWSMTRRLAARTAGFYLKLVHRTTRWRQEVPEETQALLEAEGPFIAAFWHGRMIMMRAAWPGRPRDFHMLISEHADGQLIARGMQHLGFSTISGSSRRGGLTALREMGRRLRNGSAVGITPDGPKGPRMRAKAGAISAARRAGVPILPISGAASRTRLLGTWDRFCLVLPFGRGLLLWGTPISVPADADQAALEDARLQLEAQLNGLTAEADRRVGRPKVEPAAVQPAPHELKRAAKLSGPIVGSPGARKSA
ncbi:lysophospholipid acyltransferase family protein [Algihabitans albus]|uniref:lysophospholipid acyltransferase family protein n=1 Tax=Algihabitans albus TaxID=2164067 RepID=UPI001F32E00E|nr:lysophospholipid acyltransferase family protein [Algihabitans albus]